MQLGMSLIIFFTFFNNIIYAEPKRSEEQIFKSYCKKIKHGTMTPQECLKNAAVDNQLFVSLSILDKYDAYINLDESYEHGWTLLHFAASKNQPVLVDQLLESGADPNIPDDEGFVPLTMSCLNNFTEITYRLLLDPNINVNLPDEAHKTALHYALSRKNFEAAKELLLCGADVDLLDDVCRSVLTGYIIKSKYNMDGFDEELDPKLALELEALIPKLVLKADAKVEVSKSKEPHKKSHRRKKRKPKN